MLAKFMNLYCLFLSNPSADLVFLFYMERTYIRAVQQGVNFDFSRKLKEWKIFEITWNILYRLAIFMSFYSLYLRYPSMDLIVFLHMERTYAGPVQQRVNYEFSWKLKEWEIFEITWNFLCSWSYTACI